MLSAKCSFCSILNHVLILPFLSWQRWFQKLWSCQREVLFACHIGTQDLIPPFFFQRWCQKPRSCWQEGILCVCVCHQWTQDGWTYHIILYFLFPSRDDVGSSKDVEGRVLCACHPGTQDGQSDHLLSHQAWLWQYGELPQPLWRR